MRSRFDEEMQRLHALLLEMGAMCETAIASAVKALQAGDGPDVHRAAELEQDIDRLQRDIEQLCYSLLLRQQPVARDLRQISSALKMVTDMERIGDQAADIAELAALGNVRRIGEGFTIREMSIAAIGMVNDSIDAYVKQDLALARKVIGDDDVVDDLFDKAKHALAATLTTRPEHAEGVIDMLMVAKYLERIGDHAVNIAEWVVFAVTGDAHGAGAQEVADGTDQHG